ncbi:MAG: hypothetical protein KAJ35_02520 [Thermoplasmata archaeon]|nr:hypothetical protein [Thermoplasmata archaeon]
MKLTRKIAGYILLIVGALFISMHFLAVDGSDVGGLPTFLGMGVIFLIFGILTTITCMMGEEECEGEAP